MLVAAALAGGILASCGRASKKVPWIAPRVGCPVWAPTYPPPAESLLLVEPSPDPNAGLARAARLVPGGLGGITFRKQKPVFLLVHPEKRDSAVAVLNRLWINGMPRIDFERADMEKARWTFDELYDWYRYIISHAGDVGISGYSIDPLGNRIVIGVVDPAARARVGRRLEAIGLPCYLVVVVDQPYGRF
jgi:hypothetical protein